MVILDSAPGLGYASVADIGTLDSMATKRGRQQTWFTVVGYGLQDIKPVEMADRTRLTATVQLVNLRSCFPTTPIRAAPVLATRAVQSS